MQQKKYYVKGMVCERCIYMVKQLVYTNKTLAEITFELGFSSVAHLSGQFKSYTGLNPSHFKQIKSNKSATAEGF